MVPVTACTMNTASVALPSVCHQVRPPGILRSSSVCRMPRRSMRSSTHFVILSMGLGLDPVGDAEPVVLVVHPHRAVAYLDLQFVERAGRRTGEDFAGLRFELPAMARAEEVLQVLVVDIAAAEMRAVSVIRLELVAVLRVQPHAVQGAALDPRVLLRLHEVHAHWNADVEQRDVVGNFHPAVNARLRKRGRYERTYDRKSDEERADGRACGAHLREKPSPILVRVRRIATRLSVVIHKWPKVSR